MAHLTPHKKENGNIHIHINKQHKTTRNNTAQTTQANSVAGKGKQAPKPGSVKCECPSGALVWGGEVLVNSATYVVRQWPHILS